MKCQKGDLAIVLKSYAGNEGKLVECIEFMGVMTHDHNGVRMREITLPRWRCRSLSSPFTIYIRVGQLIEQVQDDMEAFLPDAWLEPLKPLREDEDIDVETLTLSDLDRVCAGVH